MLPSLFLKMVFNFSHQNLISIFPLKGHHPVSGHNSSLRHLVLLQRRQPKCFSSCLWGGVGLFLHWDLGLSKGKGGEGAPLIIPAPANSIHIQFHVASLKMKPFYLVHGSLCVHVKVGDVLSAAPIRLLPRSMQLAASAIKQAPLTDRHKLVTPHTPALCDTRSFYSLCNVNALTG